ncbi:GhoT/OrtT family toxin [Pluralibacter gergoviae]|uniref:GhoT/OrtT family toxin n=1 Tax=Pluralibacter gergoviae TaxID=61647 RepID=UPI00092E95B8|nr:GhoT/OrtT family toxin [Pluralibacter gergoviae]
MTSWHIIVNIYLALALICSLITWFLTRDKKSVRLLASIFIGLTWPLSFPVALLFAIF